MKLRELIELNQNITDLELYIREGGSSLVDYYAIGLDSGIKPPFPMKIHPGTKGEKEGTYIHKSINAWDDGKEYWQTKVNRIPESLLDLEVYAWCNRHVYRPHHPRSFVNPSDAYEKYQVTLLPSGELPKLKEVKVKEPKEKTVAAQVDEQLPGQTSIYDFLI